MAVLWASPVAQLVKNPAGDLGSIPELGRSSGEGKGYPLQSSGLENSMDYGPRGCKVSDMTESFTFTFMVVLWDTMQLVKRLVYTLMY